MSEFEDNLWLEIVREHGDGLACAERTGHHRRATRRQLLAGTTVGLAAMATSAALLFGASTSPAAFAVTRNADGMVTVNLMQPSGIAGANEKLAAMGVRARIAVQAKTPPKLVCPGGTAPTITFDPASIPKSHMLVIAPGQPDPGKAAALKTHQAGSNGSGSTGSDATSDGGNHVVRTLSGGGNIRTYPGADNHAVRMYCPDPVGPPASAFTKNAKLSPPIRRAGDAAASPAKQPSRRPLTARPAWLLPDTTSHGGRAGDDVHCQLDRAPAQRLLHV